MTAIVVGLLALAAVMHVAWNAILQSAEDPLRASGRAVIAGVGCSLPVVAVGWLLAGRPVPPPAALGLAVVSGLVEVAYFVLLSNAYRRGQLSVVYPIARGSAPCLAVVSGTLLLGERLHPVAALGVAALLTGIVAARGTEWLARGAAPDRPASGRDGRGAVPLALATGLAIACYSTVDAAGVRLTASWLYGALLWLVCAAGLAVLLASGRRGSRPAPGRRAGSAGSWRRAALVGGLMLVAYWLVLAALSVAPLVVVSPLRESAVVVAALWGVLRLGERRGRLDATVKVGGALLIALGATLVGLSGG